LNRVPFGKLNKAGGRVPSFHDLSVGEAWTPSDSNPVQKSVKNISGSSYKIGLFVFIILLSTTSMSSPLVRAESLQSIRLKLPERIMQWTAEREDRFYDNQTIFDYIDGAGEVYRAYNMRQCLSRRYNRPEGPAIVLDIFDMGSSEDAFGVFTHDQEGEPLHIGQDALYRPNWLSFWKDHFFVSVYTEREISGIGAVMKELASRTASLIKNQGKRPQILSLLPQEGIQPHSIRYFHSHLVLNTHYFISTENILNLGPTTQAVLASYKLASGSATILIIKYPDEEKASVAQASFLRHYLPDANPSGMALLEDRKWCAACSRGDRLAIVLESESRNLAQDLLQRLNR
jgi:hypothetical protein